MVEIEAFRDNNGQRPRHRTLGFYASTFSYTVEPGRPMAKSGRCEPATRVTVNLRLTERRIQVAREAAIVPCLSDVAIAHYGNHATADGAAFGRLVGRVERRLHSTAFSAAASAGVAARDDVIIRIRAAVDQELVAYDADRKQMQEAADTEAEIGKIENACS